MLRGFGLAVALLVAGCGGGDDSAPTGNVDRACEAGRVAECPCEDGSMGIQTCNEDGSAWGECGCSMPEDGAGGVSSNSPSEDRPVGYYPSEVCEPYVGPDAASFCETTLGNSALAIVYPAPYTHCKLPKGGILAECLDLLGQACCWR